MQKKYINIFLITFGMLAILIVEGCKKELSSGYISDAIKYASPVVTVTTGRGQIRTAALVMDESTKPLECSIVAIKDTTGKVLTELMNYKVNTYWWDGTPTGLEKSIDEINKIRHAIERPAIDMNPVNGQIIIYAEATDARLFPKGSYVFDIKVKNSSGEKIFKNALRINTTPAGPYSYQFSGVDGAISGIDVKVTKLSETPNKLIIKTLKKDGIPIDPKTIYGYDYGTAANPNLKDWHNLGLQKIVNYTEFPDRIEIEYADVPIPVIGGLPAGNGIPTWAERIDLYNNGDAIGSYFNYWYDIAILEKGTWEIITKLQY